MQVNNILKVQKLLAKYLDHDNYTKILRCAIKSASLNLRYRDSDFYGEFTIELLRSLFELPMCICLNDYLLDLLASYPLYGVDNKLSNNSKVLVESIFQFFYHNKNNHIVSNFLEEQSTNLEELANSLDNVIQNSQMIDTFSRYT